MSGNIMSETKHGTLKGKIRYMSPVLSSYRVRAIAGGVVGDDAGPQACHGVPQARRGLPLRVPGS